MQVKVINKTNYIKSNDTGSEVHLYIADYDGTSVDLNSFDEVEAIVGNREGRIHSYSVNLQENKGELTFEFDNEKLLPDGEYRLEIIMHESDGSLRVAPSNDHIILYVSRALDEIGQEVNVITFQEFEERFEKAEKAAYDSADHADEVTRNAQKEENQRQDNEDERKSNESTRQSNESERESNEQDRIQAENDRQDNENTREENESTRENQENERESNEDERISSESTRESNESTRQSNETTRENQEDERQSNETTRENQESERQSNESARESAESTRESNESTRQSNEEARKSNETDRQEAIDELGFVNEWDNSMTYKKNNVVRYNGSSFISLIDDNQGNTPSPSQDTSAWARIALKGLDGEGSVVSVNDLSPDENGNVELSPADIGASPSNHSHDNATTSRDGFMSSEDKAKLGSMNDDIDDLQSNKADKSNTYTRTQINNYLNDKVDTSDFQNELSKKVDSDDFQNELSDKADKSTMTSELNKKANKTEFESFRDEWLSVLTTEDEEWVI